MIVTIIAVITAFAQQQAPVPPTPAEMLSKLKKLPTCSTKPLAVITIPPDARPSLADKIARSLRSIEEQYPQLRCTERQR